MLMIAAEMVPISPFQTLWYDGLYYTSAWCIPHRVRYGLTICLGWRHLVDDDINFKKQKNITIKNLQPYVV